MQLTLFEAGAALGLAPATASLPLRLETRTPLPTRLRIAFRLTFKRRTLFVSRESYPS